MTDEVEKREVVMRNVVTENGATGEVTYQHEARDFVPVDQLDAYVADAKTRWASVEVL